MIATAVLLLLLSSSVPRRPAAAQPAGWWHPNAHLPPDSSTVPPGTHHVRYKSSRTTARRGRRTQAATTERIRIHLDFNSLYEQTAPRYTACFRVGDWFRYGMPPGSEPPKDGVQTCIRHETTGYITARASEPSSLAARGRGELINCWGKCTAMDVITAEGRQGIIDSAVANIDGLSSLLGVEPPDGNLTFQRSTGSYTRYFRSQGLLLDETPACAKDCTSVYNVAVDDGYCSAGIGADAVLSLVKTPSDFGGGYGGPCARDGRGRPTWLVFSWAGSLEDAWWNPKNNNGVYPDGWNDGLAMRGFYYHEVLHGLGFYQSAFNEARDADGHPKGLLELKTVTDLNGDKDEVWFFTSGRAYEVALAYFGCNNESEWLGVPLMGYPNYGRGGHWESRVLRDDVMSYGMGSAVSAITLAAMEDLGFYVANYSAADCMRWGRGQGCAFVRTRCGTMRDDRSVAVSAASDCVDASLWSSQIFPGEPGKCSSLQPCAGGAGLETIDGSQMCNAMCTASDCSLIAPLGQPVMAGEIPELESKAGETPELESKEESSTNRTAKYSRTTRVKQAERQREQRQTEVQSTFYLLWGAVAVLLQIACLLRRHKGTRRVFACLCDGQACTIALLSAVMFVVGAFVVCVMAVVLAPPDALWRGGAVQLRVTTTAELVLGFGAFSLTTAELLLGLGACLVAVSCLTLVALRARSEATERCLLALPLLFWVAVILGTLAASAYTLFIVAALGAVADDQREAVQGTGTGVHEGQLGASTLNLIEVSVCRTYQLCCRDPKLDAVALAGSSTNRTCLTAHEGAPSAAVAGLMDPSQGGFCEFVTGSPLKRSETPPPAICHVVESFGAAELAACQASFCADGADGYYAFVASLTAALVSSAGWIAGGFFVGFLVLIMVTINLCVLFWRDKGEVTKHPGFIVAEQVRQQL